VLRVAVAVAAPVAFPANLICVVSALVPVAVQVAEDENCVAVPDRALSASAVPNALDAREIVVERTELLVADRTGVASTS
jgi:hypothetical protein